MRRGSIGAAIFGLVFAAFAVFVFWVAGTKAAGAPPAVLCFSIPFFAVGVLVMLSPLFAGRRARNTVYAITNQRAIVIGKKAFGGLSVTSYSPDRIASFERNQRADGTGDLVFENYQTRVGSSTQTVRKGFMGLADVRSVETILYNTLLKDHVRNVEG